MKKLTALIIILTFILSVLGVYAALTAPGYDSKPTQGTVLTSDLVNFSVRINNTNNEATIFQIYLYNRSSTSGNYSIFHNGTITNGSFWNQSNYTFKNSIRHYWFANFTNATNSTPKWLVTSTGIFNVDTAYYKQTFGSQENINFTLQDGSASFAGNVSARGFRIRNVSTSGMNCDGDTEGTLIYNQSAGIFLGCNGTSWARLNENS